MILSSLATCPLEEVAAAAPGAPRWMQVYILRDRARTEELVARAVAQGYGALVLTVDAPVSGLRLREWRAGSTFRTTWRCPTWPGAAPTAPGTAGSWPS